MRIAAVTVHTVKVDAGRAYLGPRRDGSVVPAGGYHVRPPWRSLYSARYETVLVEVAAEDGTAGWGEALAPVGPEVVAAVLDTLLAPRLPGADALSPRPLGGSLRALMRERGHLVGHQADALAALDIALWDLAARLAGVPLWQLLGGRTRDRVPVYVSGLPAAGRRERAALAAGWLARGGERVKLHAGHGVREDLADVDAVREAAPDLRVAVDAHWAYSPPDARRLAVGLAERDGLFLEAPLAPEDRHGHAALAASAGLPVAVGETMRSRYEFLDWLAAGAVGLVQPDVARTGITEALAVADMAAAHHVPVALHHSVGLAPSLAAGIHVSAVVAECPFFEYQPDTKAVADRMLTEALPGGAAGLDVPEGPGLGIDVDRAWLDRHTTARTYHDEPTPGGTP